MGHDQAGGTPPETGRPAELGARRGDDPLFHLLPPHGWASSALKRTSSQGEGPITANDSLAIGELARSTGTATSALRYYERIGLLPSAGRAGGRRYYPASSRDRLALIRLCQDAGFTLAEIRELVAGMTRGRRSWHTLAERKVGELDARIAEAQQAKALIEHALNCSHRDILTCPSFRAALEARCG